MAAISKGQIYGIGQGLVDQRAEIQDQDLATIELARGSSEIVSQARQELLFSKLAAAGREIITIPGGSLANSLNAVAHLGGVVALSARIGDDPAGLLLSSDFVASRVQLCSTPIPGGRTGQVLVAVTPDGERSMAANLGTTSDFSTEDLNPALLERAEILFLEGYLIGAGDGAFQALLTAAQRAREAGRTVALTAGSYSLINGHLEKFKELLPHITLLLANSDEACALTETSSVDEAIQKLSCQIPIAMITRGTLGATVVQGDYFELVPAFPTNVIDTTGAGDAFAGGVLFGLSRGASPTLAAQFGNFLASRVVAKVGARLGKEDWEAFNARFQ
jgi:sugar/nucleoside kinase (ribokinase family)